MWPLLPIALYSARPSPCPLVHIYTNMCCEIRSICIVAFVF